MYLISTSFLMIIFYVLIYASLSFVYCKNTLHMFQQNRYELTRYTKWLFNTDRIHFSIVIIYSIIQILIGIIIKNYIGVLINLVLSIIFAIYVIFIEQKKTYIKELVITNRVKRQIVVLSLLILVVIVTSIFYINACYIGIICIFAPYILIYLVSLITLPIEKIIQNRYLNEAKDILYSNDSLIKIGITGSYGKTSTKNIVNDLIKNSFYTLITPASYNTPMGITRTIREMLKPIHQVFVCEMGADKKDDIKYLMNFVKPKYGIVSSIGPQHLNTFKSMENIIVEKMNEIEMLDKDGVGFINLDNEYIKNYKIKNTCKIVSVAVDNKDADYVASNIKYSNSGSKFDVKINKKTYHFETVLLGKHNITNILLAISLAIELGIDIKDICKYVKQIKQVEHRLQIKNINGYTFIDDAFNSNPVGSKMALDVLSIMPNKRIIVTPGMIDLGKDETKINFEFGEYMLNKVDYVILVGKKQTSSIYEGLKNVGFNLNNVIVLDNINEAFKYCYERFSSKDTILLENDLPDAFSV